jgi:hypothetical protein
LTVEVEVACTEVGTAGPRTWTRTRTVLFPAAPYKPATARAVQPAADNPPRRLFH